MSDHEHGDWDAGGYCNRLVLDSEGDADVCGYQKPTVAEKPCENCGAPPKERTQIFRGERWCSDDCRKAVTGGD